MGKKKLTFGNIEIEKKLDSTVAELLFYKKMLILRKY